MFPPGSPADLGVFYLSHRRVFFGPFYKKGGYAEKNRLSLTFFGPKFCFLICESLQGPLAGVVAREYFLQPVFNL